MALAGRRGGWSLPDAHRLWVRADAAPIESVPHGFTLERLGRGALVAASDAWSLDELLQGWAALRAQHGLDVVPHAD